MANRGEDKTQKSLSAPTARYFLRKAHKFTPRSRPGPHSKETSVPLLFILKDMLGVTENAREAKAILSDGKVLVNGVKRQVTGLPVGLFDLVEVKDTGKKWRIVFDTKGRLVAKEADAKAKDFKISKVTGKRTVKGGKTMITTSDGFQIETGKEKINVDDSVKISLPDRKIEEVYALTKGHSVFIIAGTHVGETGIIESVTEGSLQRHKIVTLDEGEKQYQTVTHNVVVVGKGKPAIEVFGK